MTYRPTLYDIKKVFLMLGNACNFNCPHCVQHDCHPSIKKQIEPEVINWLKFLSGSRIETFKPTLIFFGGEPLLYRKTMKDVVNELKDSFNYTIISNGSLLNQNDVDWINSNQIEFVFSNDGFYTKCTRDQNMFDDPHFVDLFNQIENKSVEGVFHAFNANPYKFWNYIKSFASNTKIVLDDLICSGSIPENYMQFDLEEIKQIFDQIEKDHILFFNRKLETSPVVDYLYSKVMIVQKGRKFNELPLCGTCRTSLNIDTAGKVYLCHNSDVVIGTIQDDIIDLVERGTKELTNRIRALNKARQCSSCSAFGFCRGGCPLEEPKRDCSSLCKVRKIQWNTAEKCFNEFLKSEKENEAA